jgi:hypothetical protein
MHRNIGWIAGAVALAVVAGCRGERSGQPVATTTDEGTSVSPPGTQAAKAGRAMVRLVDAVPAGRALELAGDDRTLFTAVKYQTVTDYAQVEDNLVAFKLRREGGDSSLADDHEMMRDGVRYTVVALPAKKGEVQLRVVTDDLTPAAGKARVRVINAAPTVKSADLAVQGQKDALFSGLDPGDAPAAKDVPPGTVTLEIRRDAQGAHPVLVRDVHLEAGKTTTIVVAGTASGKVETFTFSDAPVQ